MALQSSPYLEQAWRGLVPVKAHPKLVPQALGRRGLHRPIAGGRGLVQAARLKARLLVTGDANAAKARTRVCPIEVEGYEPIA